MKQQICNNCGNNLGLLDKGHLVDGKVVCGKCIKILAPGRPKQKVNYTKIAVEAIDRGTEQAVKARKANEDARYAKAKRRVIFFLNGCVTFFWIIVLLHLLVIAAAAVAIIIVGGR